VTGVRVSDMSVKPQRRIIAFAALVEVGTGLALIIAPAMVIALLVGPTESSEALPLGRFLGIALLALGVACWPNRPHAETGSPAFRAMLTYNALVAPFLGYMGAAGYWRGLLLWPGVALHALVTLLLVWTGDKT
jgi:hypothetical protein